MRRKYLSLLLAFAMCFTFIQPISTYAAEATTTETAWYLTDLLEGDNYGIYPLSWYNDGTMEANVTKDTMSVVVDAMFNKVLTIRGAKKLTKTSPVLADDMTVEEVLKTFYIVVSNLKNYGSVGLEQNKTGAIAYMKDHNIYQGEAALDDICTVEVACAYATRIINYMFNELDAASKGFLWTVKDSDTTVYLLGSIHIASSDIYPFSNQLKNLYANADQLVVEVDLFDQQGIADYTALVAYTDGTTLKDHVSNEVYQEVLAAADKVGVSKDIIVYYKPWFLQSLLLNATMTSGGSDESSDQGLSASSGIDMYFMTFNVLKGLPIDEVEGYLKQGQMLDSFSPELQEYLLASSLASLNAAANTEGENSSQALIKEWLSEWKAGDVVAFTTTYPKDSTVSEEEFPGTAAEYQEYVKLMAEYTDKMFTQRDKGMADYIDKLLKNNGDKTYFMVVGSGHYTGETSVITALEDMGYTVTYAY
ncbi:MAG: TraB/GumN family protein [Lachnospiraceae bacterium]|nr:TraB/GumN family protein [Lachnospiraceae bacterium]